MRNYYLKPKISQTERKSNSKIFIILLSILCKIVLELFYAFVVAPNYAYLGYGLSFSTINFIVGNILYIFLILIIKYDENSIFSVFLYLQLFLMFLPMLILSGFDNRSIIFVLLIFFCIIIQIIIFNSTRVKSITKKKINYKKIEVTVLMITLVILLFSMIKVRFPTWKAFDFSGIYDLRAEIDLGTIMSYFYSWTTKIFIPLLLVISLQQKKYIKTLIYFIIAVLFYMIYVQKSIFFGPIAVLGVFWLVKKKLLIRTMLISIITYSIFSMILFVSTQKINMVIGLEWRVLFVPAHMKFAYYDFFQNNPFLYFADGMIGKIFGITSPYPKPFPIYMAQLLSGSELEGNANTGYWADAYSNLGWIGVVLFSILLAYLIKLSNRFGQYMAPNSYIAFLFMPLFLLNDMGLLTWLLTGGFIVLLFTLYIIKILSMNRLKGRNKILRL